MNSANSTKEWNRAKQKKKGWLRQGEVGGRGQARKMYWMNKRKRRRGQVREDRHEEEGTDLSSSNLVSPCLLGSHHRMDRHRQRTGRWMWEDARRVGLGGGGQRRRGRVASSSQTQYDRFWGSDWRTKGMEGGGDTTRHQYHMNMTKKDHWTHKQNYKVTPTTHKLHHGHSEKSKQGKKVQGQERLR